MKLQEIRKARGLTQRALAEASGVNVRLVQHYEQGFKDINKAAGETIKALADALGVRMEDLLEER